MLEKIIASNFLSWSQLEFTVTTGVCLIDGQNLDDGRSEGSGKSSILNAICWGSYGRVPKELNVDEVIKDGEESCFVILLFKNGDKLRRSRKPNDLFLQLASGKIVKGKDAKETQVLVEEYLGCNFETFCQSVYFAQDFNKKFLGSNQEDKAKILANIQNLQIFDKARKEVMDLLKVEESKVKTTESQLQVNRSKQDGITSQIKLIENFIEEKVQRHNQQVEQLQLQYAGIQDHIEQAEYTKNQYQEQITNKINESSDISEQELLELKDTKQTELNVLLVNYGQIKVIKDNLAQKEYEGQALARKYQQLLDKQNIYTNQKVNSTITRLYAAKTSAEGYQQTTQYSRLITKQLNIQKLIDTPPKQCPTCGSSAKYVPDTAQFNIELQQINEELTELAEQSARQVIQIEKEIQLADAQFQADREQISVELVEILEQLQVISDFLDQNPLPDSEQFAKTENILRIQLKQIDQSISKIKQGNFELDQLHQQMTRLNIQVDGLVSQQQRVQEQLAQLGEPDTAVDFAKIGVLHSQLGQFLDQEVLLNSLVSKSRIYIDQLEALKDGFKEIKSYVFSQALNELNFKTNEYLAQLFEVDAKINFISEDQKIQSNITLNGVPRALGALSGGQNQRFNLAVDLALSDIVNSRGSSKLGIIIFDEYFKNLSETSMEKCLEILKERKTPVIVIEHNSLIKNIVDNVFFVTLQNGTSFVA
jgi:DNA repair exonuclease SbcCD ATPase subunit